MWNTSKTRWPYAGLVNGRQQQIIGRVEEREARHLSLAALFWVSVGWLCPSARMHGSCQVVLSTQLSLSLDNSSLLLSFQEECGTPRNALYLMIALPTSLYVVIFIILSSKYKIHMCHLLPVGTLTDTWEPPGAGRDPGQLTTLTMSTETLSLKQNTVA